MTADNGTKADDLREAEISREVIISCDENGETLSVAIRENGIITEYMTPDDCAEPIGAFYCGRVTEYMRAYGGCFVDIGAEKRGFMPSENHRAGDYILCEISGASHDRKGVRVTDNIKLGGIYTVLIGNSSNVGVSGKICSDEERERLRSIGNSILSEHFANQEHEHSCGIIFRTEACNANEETLRADYCELIDKYTALVESFEKSRSNGAVGILGRQDILEKALLMFPQSTYKRVVCDDARCLRRLEILINPYAEREVVKRRASEVCGIDDEMARITGRRVWLKSGAYIIIDRTEAMTVIDVNSGKMNGVSNAARMARTVNLEAADEIMRQLRLRSLGGMILCDMIGMNDKAAEEELLDYMRRIAANDPGKTEIVDITGLGIVEITRKYTGRSLTNTAGSNNITDVKS